MNPLIISFIIALGINLLMFIPAYRLKTDKLTDISYSVTFVAVALFGLFSAELNPAKIVLFSMIFIWAFRLGYYLLSRIRKIGKDKRFDGRRENFWSFANFWILQGFAVFVIMIPSTFFFDAEQPQLTIISYIGIFIWLLGFLIESFADHQKTTFINDTANKGKFVNTGLWKYSRHPNYLGEILIWIGIYLFAVVSLNLNQSLIGFISPAFIAILLMFVSGIPMLEKSADKKWGALEAYQDYKKNTGILFPKYTFELLISIIVANMAGAVGGFFTASSVGSWYLTLTKPAWNPPGWVFGPVWTTLYILMGIAAFLIWKHRKTINVQKALSFYGIQLFLNLSWSILFFGLRNPGFAFIEILILLGFILLTTVQFWKIDKRAAILMFPYIAWVSFATVLNFTIWQLN